MNKYIWLTDYRAPWHKELVAVDDISHIQEELFEERKEVEEEILNKNFWGKIISIKVKRNKIVKTYIGSRVALKNINIVTCVKETPQEIYKIIKGSSK